MNKRVMCKRIVALLVSMCMIVSVMLFDGNYHVSKAAAPCVTYTGDNVEGQNYATWSSPVYSYMTTCSDGKYMLVEKIYNSSAVSVQYFDTGYNFLSNKEVALELPVFGAFFETDSNYYLLTGQTNLECDDSVEVFRLTKYDKNWNKIAHCSLFGANTTSPFDAGSARMATAGDYMIIRTAHEMYSGHQANVTIQVKMSTMTITDSYTDVMNSSYGYISHSFNQFIQIENNKIVAVDHGDAYPRSIVLLKYPKDVTSGTFTTNKCVNTNLVTFTGEIGANYTGASIGAFEISSTSYLVAGNQDINTTTLSTSGYGDGRNIFVVSMNKSSGAVTYNKITNYTAGSGITSTPHMTKIGTNSYMLLWHKGDKVYYTKIDGNGKQVGSIYSLTGDLSDCKPILASGKLMWYVRDEGETTFYSINTSDMTSSVKSVITGHNYTYGNVVTDGTIDKICSKCGDSSKVTVPTSYSCYWKLSTSTGSYYSSYSSRYNVGDTVLCWPYLNGSYQMPEMEGLSSNEDVITIGKKGSDIVLNCVGTGVAKITIRPKYNPTLQREYIFKVGTEGAIDINSAVISNPVDKNYNGYSQTQTVSVTYDGLTLSSSDYTVTYENNRNAGTATMTVTGKGLFSGTKTLTYKINPIDISGYSVTLDKTSVAYNGYEQTPYVTVRDDEGYYFYSSNYDVKYENNINPGTAKVIVTGKGNYGGTIEATFTITGNSSGSGSSGGNTGGSSSSGSSGGNAGGSSGSGSSSGSTSTGDSSEITGGGNTGGTVGEVIERPEEFVAPEIEVSYRTHIQTYGWEDYGTMNTDYWRKNGEMSGTSGESKRLEGINIVVESRDSSKPVNLGIQYTTHCQSYGWLPWSANGDMNGTEGESKRLEAIMIQLTGSDAKYYDVYYRVHAQNYGWLNWASNGEPAGTAGYSKRLEGIQIVVVKKGESFNRNADGIASTCEKAFYPKEGKSPIVNHPATSNTNPKVPGIDDVNVAYRTHVQYYGLQGWKYNVQI
ncbi:MAG: hypothetical protein IJZ96_01135, partial [Lachnospiraceae bacterium]|nr:hypothetical protein [Lachnospiraceae bacterium]